MEKDKKQFIMLPLILLLTVVPLVVHMHIYSSGLAQFNWYPANDTSTDFFLYYKAVLITMISAVMCVLLFWQYQKKKDEFKWTYQLLPLGIYAMMIALSSLFSEYHYFCLHGCTEMFETVWVVLGYCVMTFYAYQMVSTLENLDCVMKWLTIGLAVMLTLGVFQAAGLDFFSTKLGKMAITNSSQWGSLDAISIIFEKGRVFLTLYNPNYVASYFALMIPVEVGLFCRYTKLQYRILYAVMLVASLICLLGSGNRSGIVGFAATLVFALILMHRQVLKVWKFVVPGLLVVAVILGIFFSRNPMILDKFARLAALNAEEVEDDGISEIITGNDNVSITYHGEKMYLAYGQQEDGSVMVSVQDESGAQIPMELNSETAVYTIMDDRFDGFTVQVVQLENVGVSLVLNADGYQWYFVLGSDNTYYYYNVYGRLDKVNNAPRVAVKWLESKFEERGTIWSKTIPMLKDSIILGTGADTYGVTYPQDDYVDKTYDGSNGSIDVKPHCLYLQIATQYGIPALIAFLILCGWYMFNSFRIYSKAEYEEPAERIGVGIYLAIFTYLIVSILNDSTVNVSPIFWILLGVGIAVNEMLKKDGLKCDIDKINAQLAKLAEEDE